MPERNLGRTVGRFRIDAVVGSGGFAWVYRGYDPQLDIPVAIKVLKPQFAGDEAFESRFRAEASIAAKLRHPHIIRILAVGKEGDAVYSVMDYLPHGLAERLRTMTALPEPLVVRIGIDVADALAFAHREGVVHRDIKPDNILFDAHGNAIVADFGIARAASKPDGPTGTNMVVGTPQYFSPEQARGLPLDGRADLYSLGVTLFRIATGVLPFDGDDWYEIARRHVEERPPKPRSLAPGMSRELEHVILRCLSKDPDRRFPDAESLRAALAALPAGAADPGSTRTMELAPVRAARPRGTAARRGAVLAGGMVAALAAVTALRGVRGHRAQAQNVVAETSFAAYDRAARDRRDGAPPGLVPGGGVAPDSAQADSADSATTGARGSATLRVIAPSEATVRINRVVVGTGSWSSDTMPPGRYEISAALPSFDGCESARQIRSVAVAAGDTLRVPLRPVACGTLELVVSPPGAVYTITSLDNGKAWTAPMTDSSSLTLPAGRYALRVAAPPPCSPFETDTLHSIRIGAESIERKRVRLICH